MNAYSSRARNASTSRRSSGDRPGNAGGAGGSAIASTILPESGEPGGSLRGQRARGRRHAQRQRRNQAAADRGGADRDQPAPAGVQPQPGQVGAQRAAEVVERQVQAGGGAAVVVDQARDQ